MKTFSISVHGIPATQGSKRGIPIYKGPKGKKTFTGRVAVVEDNKRNKSWREAVRSEAQKVFASESPLSGPVALSITFTLPRPKKHFRTGKYSNVLRDDAPMVHSQKPDSSKLTRAVEDALKGIAWKDDSQVSRLSVSKFWGTKPGADITIQEINQ